MPSLSRRDLVALVAAAAAGTALAPLGRLNARVAATGGPLTGPLCSPTPASFTVPGFGPIAPVLPNNTASLGPLANTPLVALPAGFQYTTISIVGGTLGDGAVVPGNHDGMAAFQGRGGTTILVRNHERSPGNSTIGTRPPNGRVYDPFTDPTWAAGGTTTVVVDRNGLVVDDWISLAGTIRNCAGGPTPWGSWISCEENTSVVGGPNTKKHGYNFEVPADSREAVDPVPLVAMGRFNHEAVAVDPQTGACYQTEDRNDSCFYRFVPTRRANKAGDYAQGGDLYAMVIRPNQTGCNGALLPTTPRGGVDFRGSRFGAGSVLPFLGVPLAVDWVKLEDVDPAADTLRFEAASKGAALFYRGEGAWEHQGKIYWVNSNAGDAGEGQVVVYDPRRETIALVVESTAESLLDGPDNITVARDGTLYLCEDGSSGAIGTPQFSQRIVGVDANGGLFTFAQNVLNTSEFAGACFSPDGHYLYVNSQGSGLTHVIWRTDNRPISLEAGFV